MQYNRNRQCSYTPFLQNYYFYEIISYLLFIELSKHVKIKQIIKYHLLNIYHLIT